MTDTATIIVLLVLTALRVVVICAAAWLFVPKRRSCPHCAAATLALVSPPWMARIRVQRRWCTCGWAGWSKIVRWAPPDEGGPAAPLPRQSPGRGRPLPAPRPGSGSR